MQINEKEKTPFECDISEEDMAQEDVHRKSRVLKSAYKDVTWFSISLTTIVLLRTR